MQTVPNLTRKLQLTKRGFFLFSNEIDDWTEKDFFFWIFFVRKMQVCLTANVVWQ